MNDTLIDLLRAIKSRDLTPIPWCGWWLRRAKTLGFVENAYRVDGTPRHWPMLTQAGEDYLTR